MSKFLFHLGIALLFVATLAITAPMIFAPAWHSSLDAMNTCLLVGLCAYGFAGCSIATACRLDDRAMRVATS